MDAAGRSHSTAASPCPAALGAGVGGPGALCIAQGNSPFLKSWQLQCLCLWDSHVSRAWRWSLVRSAVQAVGVLSAKPSLSVLRPTLRGKRQPCHGSPCRYFCSSAFARLLLLRSCNTHPGLAKHPPRSRRRNKTHALLHLGTVQLRAPVRESKGVCASKWGVLGTEAFAEEHPCALHPWAMPRRATELPVTAPAAASWGHRSFPFPVPRLPKSLETHQLLSKPCNMGPLGEGRSGGKPCTFLPAVVNLPGEGRGERGTWRSGAGVTPTTCLDLMGCRK